MFSTDYPFLSIFTQGEFEGEIVCCSWQAFAYEEIFPLSMVF
jgi:hypothetical protein